MDHPRELLSINDAARLLSVEPRRIKQLVRDRQLFTVRDPDGVLAVPAEIIVKGENGWEPLFSLPGTLTLLADGGFSAQEAVEWLYTEQEELGQTPMSALLAGRHHRVNSVAAMLAL